MFDNLKSIQFLQQNQHTIINICQFKPFLFSVHPCDKPGKAGCQQICKKVGEEPQCACEEGYKLIGEECEKSKLRIND